MSHSVLAPAIRRKPYPVDGGRGLPAFSEWEQLMRMDLRLFSYKATNQPSACSQELTRSCLSSDNQRSPASGPAKLTTQKKAGNPTI